MFRFALIVVLVSVLTGCHSTHTVWDDFSTVDKVACVVVGMESSGRFGPCPGCARDAEAVSRILREEYGYPVRTLVSQDATRDAVVSSMREAVSKVPSDGLFIFHYSGHGGREDAGLGWTTEPPGLQDSTDEYLCLEDTYLLDDEIWDIISQCHGHVVLIFDACHSQTMFRSVRPAALGAVAPLVRSSGGFRLRPAVRALADPGTALDMLCWSACLEDEQAYGDFSGGLLTTMLVKWWRPGLSYAELWALACSDIALNRHVQIPAQTAYGDWIDRIWTEVFR